MSTLKLVLAIVLGLALMIVVAANMAPVDLHLVPKVLGIADTSVRGVPLAIVIVGTFLLGFLVGELVEFTRERKYRAQLGQKRRELAAVREENERLARQVGVKDDDLALVRR
jgi:lipopolysaccharide assembly protein A